MIEILKNAQAIEMGVYFTLYTFLVFLLFIVDLVAGTIKSYQQQIPILSDILKQSVTKISMYIIALVAGYVGDVIINISLLPFGDKYLFYIKMPMLITAITALISSIELISIFENADKKKIIRTIKTARRIYEKVK